MQLIIGNKNYSSWSLRAWLLLTEHKIPFEEVRETLCQADSKTRLLQHSATGLVPVLRDQGLIVSDSLAICEYISETYLNGLGWPESASARALARSCAAEMHSGFKNLRGRMPMNCRATQRTIEIDPAINAEITRIDQLFTQLRNEHQAKGPWLFGSFSITDCFFAPVVLRFNTYGIELSHSAQQYALHVINNESIRQWIQAAKKEPEIIKEDEVGL
ncbi:MAG: glutathione S-transferase family protein [Acidiferrobacterales bacterium]|nr:glutathione S-transferase family protein [Acidiferrobacterales bacterium]